MIDKNDFIKAVGEPDRRFRSAAEQALNAIRDAECRSIRTRKPRNITAFVAAAAVLTIAVLSGALLLGPRGSTPDRVAAPGKPLATTRTPYPATPEPTIEPTAEATAEATTEPTPQAMTLTEFFKMAVNGSAETPLETEENESRYSIGIIGGADGPTSIYAMGEAYYESVDQLAHGMLFENAFGASFDALYSDYQYIRVVGDKRDVNGREYMCQEVHAGKNGDEICALALSKGEVQSTDSSGNAEELMTLWVEMPGDVSLTDAFFDGAEYPAAYIYKESCKKLGETEGEADLAWTEYPLNGIKITFDTNDRPMIYQMFFGDDCEICMLWAYDPDAKVVSFGDYYKGGYFAGFFERDTDALLPTPMPTPEEPAYDGE